MDATLELNSATVIILGSWNSKIFAPEWIVHHLHGYEIGENVQIAIVHEVESNKKIFIVNDIGLSVHGEKIELFINSTDNFDSLKAVVNRIYTVLPHTPFGPFGINYKFISKEPDIDVISRLDTQERLDAEYEILRRELKTQLKRDNQSVINLTRIYSEGRFEIGFNFHFSITDAGQIIQRINEDICARCLDEAKNIIANFYNINDFGIVGFGDLPDEALGRK